MCCADLLSQPRIGRAAEELEALVLAQIAGLLALRRRARLAVLALCAGLPFARRVATGSFLPAIRRARLLLVFLLLTVNDPTSI